jgi:hypothetical protein
MPPAPILPFLGLATMACIRASQPGFLPVLSAASADVEGGTGGGVPASGSTNGQNVRWEPRGSNALADDSSPSPLFSAAVLGQGRAVAAVFRDGDEEEARSEKSGCEDEDAHAGGLDRPKVNPMDGRAGDGDETDETRRRAATLEEATFW